MQVPIEFISAEGQAQKKPTLRLGLGLIVPFQL